MGYLAWSKRVIPCLVRRRFRAMVWGLTLIAVIGLATVLFLDAILEDDID